MKTAIITGVTGQDGSYLAELLLAKGYRVIGITDSADPEKRKNIEHIDNLPLVICSVTNSSRIAEIIKVYQPDEYYNLAAQSFVGTSWDNPYNTLHVNVIGCLNALEAIKNFKPDCRFYQASSSEMFGNQSGELNEVSSMIPKSPYGISKLTAHNFTVNYRESFGLFAVAGILFNHESERRGPEFVTRKITMAAAAIKAGKQKDLKLGNIFTARDWGYAPDYVEAMWLMLQQDKPKDYVIATGHAHTVKKVAEIAFSTLGMDWENYTIQDDSLRRPNEIYALVGNVQLAQSDLGWKPSTSFEEMISKMVLNDLKLIG